MALNSIQDAANAVKTYSSVGKLDSDSKEHSAASGIFGQMISNPIEKSYAHEAATLKSAQGDISQLDLLQASTDATLSIAEFKAYWNQFLDALNKIYQTNV